VAVAVQFLLAEVARTAKDIERYQHMVADLQVLYRRADLLDYTGELVSERRADMGIRHQAMVKMQVRSADARTRNPHDCIVWMLYLWVRLLFGAHPVGAPEFHCQHCFLLLIVFPAADTSRPFGETYTLPL
jgi:hypothetical protein